MNVRILEILQQIRRYGGICGDRFKGRIVNCLNEGTIKSNGTSNYGVGGICGNTYNGTAKIENCINRGNIYYLGQRSSWYFGGAGGIIGLIRSEVTIKNTVNIGNVESTSRSGAICGMELYYWDNGTKYERENLYYLNNVKLCTGSIEDDTENATIFGKEKSGEVVDGLNSFIEEESEWKLWRVGNDGYPTFE